MSCWTHKVTNTTTSTLERTNGGTDATAQRRYGNFKNADSSLSSEKDSDLSSCIPASTAISLFVAFNSVSEWWP